MATINSRASLAIDRMLGYLGLFLIGLIGWVFDHLPATQAREHSLRPGRREHAGLLRK